MALKTNQKETRNKTRNCKIKTSSLKDSLVFILYIIAISRLFKYFSTNFKDCVIVDLQCLAEELNFKLIVAKIW